ncbi:hypothetical protein [Dysgonomonas sp. ZJ709]|uniref:hypothetical protein n=1 Tax=Dysgonomonas sp. ZJ709 TaxID=2709797 RepID=UPI0013EA9EA3|nr:hypothetical protein [Dysgonomonas sp. ZJ709]
MRKLLVFLLAFIALNAFSQNIDLEKKAQQLTEEGKLLYRLELAAWHGTDIFFENYKERERVGGYFSYLESNTPKCLFFSKGANPKVLGVVSYGDLKVIETASIDFKEREFNENEKHLFTIRAKALAEIQQDTALFKTYTNTSLNMIPLIFNGEKKVYVLTGTKLTDVVLFGNDYLLTFDKKDMLLTKKELHRNLIPIYFEDGQNAVGSVHSHTGETGDFITPTDICTLMLYAKYAKWKQHIVMSQNYVSIWDCEKESLVLMSKEDFQNM